MMYRYTELNVEYGQILPWILLPGNFVNISNVCHAIFKLPLHNGSCFKNLFTLHIFIYSFASEYLDLTNGARTERRGKDDDFGSQR